MIWWKLIITIGLSELAGIIGSIFTTRSISGWYANLNKPFFSPPNYLFGPVWGGLYLLMGIAAALVWQKGLETSTAKIAFGLFWFQLVLNGLWSYLFFGLQNPLAGFIEIIFLWGAIVATIYYFFKISTAAGALMIPYVSWVTFAALLNFYIWQLNS